MPFAQRLALFTRRLQQVPQIAVQILENRDRSVALDLGLTHEGHAPRKHLLIVAPEIVCIEKQEDATTRLISDPRYLILARRLG